MTRVVWTIILGIAAVAVCIVAVFVEPALVAVLLLVAWLAGWLDRWGS